MTKKWKILALAAIGLSLDLSCRAADTSDSALLARGKYVATAADCVSCHTESGSGEFAGGNALKSSLGTLYGSNITPDADTGIGSWSEADFERALRQGVRKDGSYLYPAMPYGNYTKMTDEDLHALWVYMRSVPAVHHDVPKNSLPFPFNVRSGMRVWNSLYFTPGRFQAVATQDAKWNRGAYLVDALEHCNECHTPRSVTQSLESGRELTGARIEGWYAPDISSEGSSVVNRWSDAQLAAFLKSGVLPNNTKAVGPMLEVVNDSTKYLTQPDLEAMVYYLKKQPGTVKAQAASAVKFARVAQGKEVYDNHCAGCHQSDGKGQSNTIPALAGNDAVNAREPFNVIMAILEGFPPQGTWGAMASFATQLSDEQISDVANYVRTAWNGAGIPNATPWAVSSWRSQAPAPESETRALSCPNLDAKVLAPALALDASSLQRAADDQAKMSDVVRAYRSKAPKATNAEVVEALSTAYCRSLASEKVSEARMDEQLASFAQAVAVKLHPHAPTG